MRGLEQRMSVGAPIPVTLVIGQDKEDVRLGGGGGFGGAVQVGGAGQNQKGQDFFYKMDFWDVIKVRGSLVRSTRSRRLCFQDPGAPWHGRIRGCR